MIFIFTFIILLLLGKINKEVNMIVRKVLPKDVERELKEIGVDLVAFEIFKNKSEIFLYKLYGIDSRGANILKQEFLSAGGDVAVSKDVASWRSKTTDCLLIGTYRVYERVFAKLSSELYFGLKLVKEELSKILQDSALPSYLIRGRTFDFNSKKFIMGVLNVTPDSFSDGGNFLTVDKALTHAEGMIKEGADIIDIGGESTRPGAEEVPEDLEIQRVAPVIKSMRESFPDVPISIDTYKASVAKVAIENGADIINDISGLRFGSGMVAVAKEFDVPVIVMHIKGTPKDMQKNPTYDDLMKELLEYFEERILALTSSGVNKIIIDPGIGFGKRIQDNLHIIRNLSEFSVFNKPVLVGLSRKYFIGSITGEPFSERLYGTLAANVLAITNGAHIIRVHDVRPHKEMLDMLNAIEHFDMPR
jgi:dihydropteroate synthase